MLLVVAVVVEVRRQRSGRFALLQSRPILFQALGVLGRLSERPVAHRAQAQLLWRVLCRVAG